MVYLLLLVFLVFALIGEPLFIIIGIITFLSISFISNGAISIVSSIPLITEGITKMSESPFLLAIPFFTFAGSIMARGDIAKKLIRFTRALIGPLPGGLAIVAILVCTFFAAITGSSAVTIIAIGAIIYPALREKKYSEKFSLGILTGSGAIGILAPPSLAIIIYSIFARVNSTDMFKAALIPAILTISGLSVFAVISGLMGSEIRDKFDIKELKTSLKDGIWSLLLPVFLLGAIYGGITTVTEASVFVIVYTIFIEVWVHKSIKIKDIPEIAVSSMSLVGSIMVILLMAFALTNFLTIEKIPEKIVHIIRHQDIIRVNTLKFNYTLQDRNGNNVKIKEGKELLLADISKNIYSEETYTYKKDYTVNYNKDSTIINLTEKSKIQEYKDIFITYREQANPDERALMDVVKGLVIKRIVPVYADLSKPLDIYIAKDEKLISSYIVAYDNNTGKYYNREAFIFSNNSLSINTNAGIEDFSELTLIYYVKTGFYEQKKDRDAKMLKPKILTEKLLSAEQKISLSGDIKVLRIFSVNIKPKKIIKRLIRNKDYEIDYETNTVKLIDKKYIDKTIRVVTGAIKTKFLFLLAVNILLLIVGCIMDIFSALVVVAPLLIAIAPSFDVNLIHLGIIFVVNMEIGFATPPFGLNLFIASSFFNKPVLTIFKATIPFLIILLIALIIITYVPVLSLFWF